MRRAARESVFKLVFEYTFYDNRNEDTLELMLMSSDLNEDDKAFINNTYSGVVEDLDGLRDEISKHLETYKIERIYRPDLAALLLATFELKKSEVPQAVVINEAVELAKKYGTDKSGAFVNGVLGKVAKDFIK